MCYVTDVLCAGYVHDFESRSDVAVVNEIVGLIFMFWYIVVSDVWDKSCSNLNAEINGQRAGKGTANKCCTIYGTQSVARGSLKWNLKFKTKMKWICIGIIKDDPKILKENQVSNNYRAAGDGIFLFFDHIGVIMCHRAQTAAHDVMNKENTICAMTLDMDKRTITYKIDDYDEIVEDIQISGDKFRLAVTLNNTESEQIIELL